MSESTALAPRRTRLTATVLAARSYLSRNLSPKHQKILAVAGLTIFMAGISAVMATWRDFFDLHVYHDAVNYWAHGNGSIYDFVLPRSTYGFTYTPFAAMVMLPLAMMPFVAAIVTTCIAIVAVTVLVISWFVHPIARQQGWTPWFATGLATACVLAFDPFRETLLFGQVNMYLVAMVGFDLLFLLRRGSRFAGVGIGLATALKLTPGVFLLYLVVTRRWRAALTASSAAAAATLVGAALAPDASRVFWTDALWNTSRVGQPSYISNQALMGAVARLSPLHPSNVLWLALVVAVLAVWAVRVHRAVRAGDERAGFALTGVVTCLISPITWIHHLVWVLPALLVLYDHSVSAEDPRRRRRMWAFTLIAFGVLSSRIVWAFDDGWSSPLAWFLSNAYLWVTLALLFGTPISTARATASRPTVSQTPAEELPAAPATAGTAAPARESFDDAMANLLRDAEPAAAPRNVRGIH